MSKEKDHIPADSDNPKNSWGTVFSQGRETALGGIEQQRSTYWNEKDEAAYLARVKERATAMATSILEDAKDEAAQIRKEASDEGYEAGLKAAEEELTNFRSSVADSVAGLLRTIDDQRTKIFTDWREDVVGIIKIAVEKVIYRELAEDRSKLLENLFLSAVALLDERKEFLIHVHPSDEPLINDVMGLARDKYHDITSWRVNTDHTLSPGGMIIETASSLAESRVEARQKAVMDILTALSLEEVYESKS